MADKDYIIVVQCDLVKQRCSGYLCEWAFTQRNGGFTDTPEGVRMLPITCGGCCGRALHRKIANLLHKGKGKEGLTKEKVAVRFSSCIVTDNYHGPPCPHLDYLKALVAKHGLEVYETTVISNLSAKRRDEGLYEPL